MQSLFLDALKRHPTSRTPIWMMRQAGRYLPEYRAIREKVGGFLGMCKNPDIASQITLQPLSRFELDAAIIFSDILTIPDAMGLGLNFVANEGPQFLNPVRDMNAIQQLKILDPIEDLGYVMDAIRVTVPSLKVPLIGFCGSPWTVATYMVEGKSSKNFSIIKRMLYEAPETLKLLLAKLAKTSSLYLQAQAKAGASALMIFDSWGGVLSTPAFHEFSLFYMQQIVDDLKSHPDTKHTPVILFTKQGNLWLESLANTGCEGLGVDWSINLKEARRRVGDKVALQGNLDPSILYASPENITHHVREILLSFGKGNGHIFNLGHGIHPDIPVEHVQALIEAVHQYSPAYHQQNEVLVHDQ